jgi:hypothetical protein
MANRAVSLGASCLYIKNFSPPPPGNAFPQDAKEEMEQVFIFIEPPSFPRGQYVCIDRSPQGSVGALRESSAVYS